MTHSGTIHRLLYLQEIDADCHIFTRPNYPLPPKCEKTEILRVVVRESMSLDLLDRLITDIVSVTEQIMDSDPMDLAAFQLGSTSIEKQHQSKGVDHRNKHQAERPMSKGVHRTVC